MRRIGAIVLAVVPLLAGGCAQVVSLGPGGASPGLVITDTTYPNAVNPSMRYEIGFRPDDIELRGPVQATARSMNVLGIASWGDSGFGKLMDAARAQGADGVMNVTVDTQFKTVLFLYSEVVTKLTGQAYAYKKQ
ncbi:MAG: TRL domain-containing protein [Candidatus Brocadiia bacterium]